MHNDSGPDFLVVGLQKCGSYWVTAILDAHPEISCIPPLPGGKAGVGEGHIFDILGSIDSDNGASFTRSFKKKHNGFFSDLVPILHSVSRDELYDKFRERYNQWCDMHRSKKIVGDKTTEYVFHLDIIDYFYEDIKKLCIIRDVKDRIVSFNFHQIRKGRKNHSNISDSFVDQYIDRVKNEYNSMLSYNKDIFCFTYESLQECPETIVRSILNYLNVSISDDIIHNIIKEASFDKLKAKDKSIQPKPRKTLGAISAWISNCFLRSSPHPSCDKKNSGIESQDSHFRKGITGDWKNHLTNEQAEMINSSISELQNNVYEKYKIIDYEKQ